MLFPALFHGRRWGIRGAGQSQRPTPPRRSFRPRLELLEDRSLPSTFTVANLLDSGPGSLRQAVLDANSSC
jgi:hypothetical protein